eukprot:8511_1
MDTIENSKTETTEEKDNEVQKAIQAEKDKYEKMLAAREGKWAQEKVQLQKELQQSHDLQQDIIGNAANTNSNNGVDNAVLMQLLKQTNEHNKQIRQLMQKSDDTQKESQVLVGWDYNSDNKHLNAKEFVCVTGEYIDVWKKFTDAVGKKRKRKDPNYDSDDSDNEWARLSGNIMDKTMKKKCPMDIVGPITYRLLENLNDQELNAVLKVNANRSFVENVGVTELSKIMFHANTPSGLLLNLMTILLGRRNVYQRLIADKFDSIQRRIISDEDIDVIDIQTEVIDLCQEVLTVMDEPVDMMSALLKIVTFSSSNYFQDRIEAMTRKAVKDKFNEPIPVVIQEAKLTELINQERINFIVKQSSFSANKAKKQTAKLWEKQKRLNVNKQQQRGAFTRSELLGKVDSDTGDNEPARQRRKGICDKDNNMAVCKRRDCKFKHPWRAKLQK